MAEPFLGELRMFAGNFAPRDWAFCDGQILPINQNSALFSLFGTIYGGDGRTTFALPDMRGRVPVHQGQGPGLLNHPIGSKAGAESVVLLNDQIPAHNHAVVVTRAQATERAPSPQVVPGRAEELVYGAPGNSSMDSSSVGIAGETQSHTNVMPFTCVNFIVALVGIFPSRN